MAGLVSASPPPPGGLLGDRLGVGQAPFGFSSLDGDDGQLSSGLAPFRLPVDGDGGVEVVEVAGHGSAGVAEPVDTVGQGVIGSDTGGDDLSPVVIEAVLQLLRFRFAANRGCARSTRGGSALVVVAQRWT